MSIRKYFLILLLLFGSAFYNPPIHASEKLETVTIQFKWFHQFQFAGYYAAVEKGFYTEEGLDVTLHERNPETDHIKDVLEGKAQYGVADAGLLLSRLQGNPVVMLSQIFQHSPLVFLTLQKSGIRTPFDLTGKSVMIYGDSYVYPSLNALIIKTLGGLDKVTRIPETYRNDDLVEGKTDAMVGYITDQPFWFKERSVDVNVIDPRDYGIDFYGDNFFTTEKEIREHPHRVKKMIRATIKGWRYALEHKDEIVDLILKKYNTQKLSRKHLTFEADATEKMIIPRFVDLGHFEPSRFWKIAETYVSLGLTDRTDVDEGFFYREATPQINLSPDEQAWLVKHPKIDIAIMDAWPPMNYIDEDGTPRGIGVDYINALNKRLNGALNIVPMPFKKSYELVKTGKLDALMDITHKKEREPFFNFTRSYLAIPHVIIAQKGGPYFNSDKDLAGKLIALEKGFYNVKYFRQNYPDVIVKEYESTSDCLDAVSRGEADAYAGNRAVATNLIAKEVMSNLQVQGRLSKPPVTLSVGVRKDFPELASIIDRALASLTEDEKHQIVRKWAGLDERDTETVRVPLTPGEEAWLKAHPIIRVHNEKNWPPFNYFEYGSSRGLSIDYMNLLAERLGLEIEYVTGPSWNDFLRMIKRKELDVMLNIVKTEDRMKYIRYTDPYIRNPNVIISSQKHPYETIQYLFGKTVAFPKGFFYEEVLTKSFPQIKHLPLEDTLASLKAVTFGKADAALGEEAVVQTLINKNMLTGLRVSGEVNIGNPDLVNLRIGVRDDWPMLQSAIMKAMAGIAPQEMNQLRQKWMVELKDEASKAPLTDEGISSGRLITYTVILFIVLSLFSWILIKIIKKENIAAGFGSPRFRLFVLSGLSIIIIIICLLGWFTLERNKEKVLVSVGESLQMVLNAAHERLNFLVTKKISIMRLLGRDPELWAITQRLLELPPIRDNLLTSRALLDARTFFKNNEEIFANIGFFIINPDHISIGCMWDANIGTQNLISTQRPDLLKRAFEGEVLFVPPIQSDVPLGNLEKTDGGGKQDIRFFIGPIRDLNGRIIAVMSLCIDTSKYLSQALQAYGMLKSGETYAINREGFLLSESRFNDKLRQIGLIEKGQPSALNIEIRDPVVNMAEGHHPILERSRQPLTHMASRAIQLKSDMEKAGQHQGHSEIEVDTKAYRDYRGVPVFGTWLWSTDLGFGLATEIDAHEALSDYYMMRRTVFGVLGFTLFLSVGAILFVLILGERASQSLMKARDNLEEKIEERTAELRKNRERLAATEERSRLLLHSAGDGICGVDIGGRINFVNPSVTSMLGYPEEELIGQEVHQLIHHSHADGSLYPPENCPMLKAYTDGTSHHVDDEVLWRKDETYFQVEYTATPMKKDGRLTGAVITFNDITERKQAEEELRQNMEDLERFSKLAVGREERMIKLKKEINELLRELGRPDKYKIVGNSSDTKAQRLTGKI